MKNGRFENNVEVIQYLIDGGKVETGQGIWSHYNGCFKSDGKLANINEIYPYSFCNPIQEKKKRQITSMEVLRFEKENPEYFYRFVGDKDFIFLSAYRYPTKAGIEKAKFLPDGSISEWTPLEVEE